MGNRDTKEFREMFCPRCEACFDVPRVESVTATCDYCRGSRLKPNTGTRVNERRNADRIDGYDRDDIGLSPDF